MKKETQKNRISTSNLAFLAIFWTSTAALFALLGFLVEKINLTSFVMQLFGA